MTLESYFFKVGWISSWTPHPLPALPEGGTALEQMEISSGQGGLSWLRFSQQGSASHFSFFHNLISASTSAVTKPLTHFFYGPAQMKCAVPRSRPAASIWAWCRKFGCLRWGPPEAPFGVIFYSLHYQHSSGHCFGRFLSLIFNLSLVCKQIL